MQSPYAPYSAPQPAPKRTNSLLIGCLASCGGCGTLLFLFIVLGVVMLPKENIAYRPPITSPPAASFENPAAELQILQDNLAYYDGVYDGLTGDDKKRHRFGTLLVQLAKTYNEKPSQIANETRLAQTTLQKYGVKESLLNMMEGMNQITPLPSSKPQYSAYIAAYMVLRRHGSPHAKAVRRVPESLKNFQSK